MNTKKRYSFSETIPMIMDIIVKIKKMEVLSPEDQLLYLVYVKGMTEKDAQKMMMIKQQIIKTLLR